MSRSVIAALVTLGLVLSSCGSSTTDLGASPQTESALDQPAAAPESPTEPDSAEDPVTEPGPTDAERSSADLGDSNTDDSQDSSLFVPPISDFLGVDPNRSDQVQREYVLAAEELVGVCMRNLGFEYEITYLGPSPADARRSELRSQLSQADFAEKYGYGEASLLEMELSRDGIMRLVAFAFGTPPPVPRSPQEQEAYELALFGRSTVGLDADEATATLLGGSEGCRQDAYRQAQTGEGAIIGMLNLMLSQELQSMEAQIAADPRMVEESQRWQRCMGTDGFDFDNSAAASAQAAERSRALFLSLATDPNVEPLLGQALDQGLAAMTLENRELLIEELGGFEMFNLIPDLRPRLDEAIDWERQVASTDLSCADVELRRQVISEYQKDFIAVHQQTLEQIRNGS